MSGIAAVALIAIVLLFIVRRNSGPSKRNTQRTSDLRTPMDFDSASNNNPGSMNVRHRMMHDDLYYDSRKL